MLQPRECFGGIELATRHVSTRSYCTVDEFEALLDQSTLAAPSGAIHTEGPLFCAELQSQLLDITLSFAEDFNGWHEVWATSGLLVEEDAILLLDGQLAIEDSEDLPCPVDCSSGVSRLKNHALGLHSVSRVTFTRPCLASCIFFLGVESMIASVRRKFMCFLGIWQDSRNSSAYAIFRCSI